MIFKCSFWLAASQSEATLENQYQLTNILSEDNVSSANPRAPG